MEMGGESNGIVFVFQKQNDHIQLEGNLTWFCKNCESQDFCRSSKDYSCSVHLRVAV